jgi:hypothetical protein
MKTLLRNRKNVFYALPTGQKVKATDRYGNYTGETVPEYGAPQEYTRLSSQNVKGLIKTEAFGLADGYDTTFVTCDMNCPITIGARLWIDKTPNTDGTDFTHLVKAVLPTINTIKIIVENVSVS